MNNIKIHEILPGLVYQRGDLRKHSREEKKRLLAEREITVVIALVRPVDADLAELLTDGYLFCPIPDGKRVTWDAQIRKLVATAVELHQLLGGAVLTHCHAGRNRSGMVNALLVKALTGCSPQEAIDRVRAGRPNALANEHFVDYILADGLL